MVLGVLAAAVPALAASTSDHGDGTAAGQGGNVAMQFGESAETTSGDTTTVVTNPEIVTDVTWVDSTGATNHVAVAPRASCDGFDQTFFGEALSTSGPFDAGSPIVTGDNRGGFTGSGGATLAMDDFGDSVGDCNDQGGPGVHTEYTFFDAPYGDGAQVTRTVQGELPNLPTTKALSPRGPSANRLAAYIPRLPIQAGQDLAPGQAPPQTGYWETIWPSADGTTLRVADVGACANNIGCDEGDWDGTWFADYDPGTGIGMAVVRDPADTLANPILHVEEFGLTNASNIQLPWDPSTTATESEYLCFFDSSTVPQASVVDGAPRPSLPASCPAVPRAGAPTIPDAQTLGVPTSGDPQAASWTGSPTHFTYQWERCNADGTGCVDITDANRSVRAAGDQQAYTPTATDIGHRLRLRVVAFNGAGASLPAESNLSGIVAAPASTTPASPASSASSTSTQPKVSKPRACVSRRHFAVHVAARHGRITRAVVLRNGKRVRGVKVKIHKGTVDLRGLPKGTFKVRITIRHGKRVKTQTRTYHTCVPRR